MLYGITTASGKTSFMEMNTDVYKAQQGLKALFAERKLYNVAVFPANYEYLAVCLAHKALTTICNDKTSKAKETKHIENIFTVETTKQAFTACLVPEEKEKPSKRNTSIFDSLRKETACIMASIANYINNVPENNIHDENGIFINLSHDTQVVTGYIDGIICQYSQDVNDVISSAKVAIYEYLPEVFQSARQANESAKGYTLFSGTRKEGYKAVNKTVYDSKKKPIPLEKDKIDILARLKMYRAQSVRNTEQEKAFDDFIQTLSPDERTIASYLSGNCHSLRYISEQTKINLALVYEYKASIAEKILAHFQDNTDFLHMENIQAEIASAKEKRENRIKAKKASKKAHDKKRNSTPERKAYLAQKAKERRARQKAQKAN